MVKNMVVGLRRATTADLASVVGLQHAAYAANRAILGVEPLPLLADYAHILASMEVWLRATENHLDGVLILKPRADDLLIWSIAIAPDVQQQGIGRVLLDAAHRRATELGLDTLRLYTGTLLTDRVDGYLRYGFVIERIDEMPDRSVTHMVKRLP